MNWYNIKQNENKPCAFMKRLNHLDHVRNLEYKLYNLSISLNTEYHNR